MDLIISPHADDEALGCSSFLTPNTTVLYLTSRHPLFPDGQNVSESKALQRECGFAALRHDLPTNLLSTMGESELIRLFEETIATVRPHTVLLPFPSYNQDHRMAYECALTALRVHDRLPFVTRVLVYEETDVWGTMRKVEPFRPTYFRPIDMDRKLELWRIYQSQQRGHRSVEFLRAMAKVRGEQCHVEYAEAFEVLRWCD